MTANSAWWGLGVLLEALLLTELARRGAVRRSPWFGAILAFYLLRSVLLFALFGHVDAAGYELTSTALSSLDLPFEVAVAWELYAAAVPRQRRPVALFAALVVGATSVAWLLSRALPGSARIPVDRGVLFTSVLMLAVFSLARARPGGLQGRVLQGFALLGAAGVLAQVGRSIAALYRDGRALARWSWVEPVAYLAVLVFWTVAVLTDEAEEVRLPAGASSGAS